MVILYLWRLPFHVMIVIGHEHDFSFKSAWASCEKWTKWHSFLRWLGTFFFHANPISLRFQPGDFWPPEMRVCVSMYWRLSQGVKSLFQPLVWNHFSDPWGWKHFSVPGTETVSKWFHPRDGKAASLFYSKSSNIHPPLTGITQGVKLVDELGCHS